MEQIIQSIKNQNCIFWLGKHINAKNNTRLTDLAKNNDVFILNQEKSEGFQFTSSNILLIIEPDFSSDMEEIVKEIGETNEKPRIFFLCNQVNIFALPPLLQKKYTHIKKRSKDLIKVLEKHGNKGPSKHSFSSILGTNSSKPKNTIVKKNNKGPLSKDPVPNMIGREIETENLLQYLKEDGAAIWLTGKSGIGKRTLLENTIVSWNSENPIVRLIDVNINSFVHVDSLLGRIAMSAKKLGDDRLFKALRGQYTEISNNDKNQSSHSGKTRVHMSPEQIVTLLINTLQKNIFSNHVLVIHNIQRLLHKNNISFASDGYIEMILEALSSNKIQMRVILVSTSRIDLSSASNARHIHLEGLTQESAIKYAKNYGTSFPEDVEIQTQLFDKTNGHPMAIRELFHEFHKQTPVDKILERNIGSYKNLSRTYKYKMQNLTEEERKNLHKIFYHRNYINVEELNDLDINRQSRVALLHQGLLEKINLCNSKGYYIHPIAKKSIPFPEHGHMEDTAKNFLREGKSCFHSKDLSGELFYIQEANALFAKARKGRDSGRTMVPFSDPFVGSIQSSIRKQNYTKIGGLLSAAFRAAPHHPNLYLLEIELFRKTSKTRDEILAKIQQMKEKSAVPETYIVQANYLRDIRSDAKAMNCLEEGIRKFPNSLSLISLASKHALQIGNNSKSIHFLKIGIEKFPTNPQLYTLLGANLLYIGTEQWERAEETLRKAEDLYSRRNIKNPPFHQFQVAHFHRLRAYVEEQNFENNIEKSEQQLRQIIENNSKYTTATIELITVLLDRCDLDGKFEERKADIVVLMKKVNKINKNLHGIVQKARFRVYEGNIEEAMTLLDKAYSMSNTYHLGFYVRGTAFFAQKSYVRSLNAFRSALNNCSDNSPYQNMYQKKADMIQGLLENTEIDFEELARENAALHPTSNPNQTDDNEGFRTEAGMVRRRTQREPETTKTETNPKTEDVTSKAITETEQVETEQVETEQVETEQVETEQEVTTESTVE